MKKSSYNYLTVMVLSILLIPFFLTDCKKTENPIKFPQGTFPDTVIYMSDLNTQYDDYNVALYQITGASQILFSSNRKSAGTQFDLEQGSFSFLFDQTSGVFGFGSQMTTDPFLDKLINKAVTTGNDFGPYRLYSSADGFEYLILSSVNLQGNLDLYYLKNRPVNGTTLPDVNGPFPVKSYNTSSDDAYLSLNNKQDSLYFTSSRTGNFDIYVEKIPSETSLTTLFDRELATTSRADSVNSSSDEKCPWVYKNIMVFTSNRPGGMGGYDLYYSVMRKGKWSSPVNLGPKINSSADEYRPVIGYHSSFTNNFLMFSSNRSGGKGGFDLCFTGVEFPVK